MKLLYVKNLKKFTNLVSNFLVFRFKKSYFLAALFFFILEVLIALYIKDAFLRPYGGDFLVIFFLYSLLKAFFRIPVKNAIFGVLLFAFVIEGLQYFNFVRLLGLEENKIASVALGSHFEWLDMVLYSLGALIIALVERSRGKSQAKLKVTAD